MAGTKDPGENGNGVLRKRREITRDPPAGDIRKLNGFWNLHEGQPWGNCRRGRGALRAGVANGGAVLRKAKRNDAAALAGGGLLAACAGAEHQRTMISAEEMLKTTGGGPNGIRTRVSALRGPCPRPLDDGAVQAGGTGCRAGTRTPTT